MKIAPEIQIRLFREMLRIRKVQLKIESLYALDEMKTMNSHLAKPVSRQALAAALAQATKRDTAEVA